MKYKNGKKFYFRRLTVIKLTKVKRGSYISLVAQCRENNINNNKKKTQAPLNVMQQAILLQAICGQIFSSVLNQTDLG